MQHNNKIILEIINYSKLNVYEKFFQLYKLPELQNKHTNEMELIMNTVKEFNENIIPKHDKIAELAAQVPKGFIFGDIGNFMSSKTASMFGFFGGIFAVLLHLFRAKHINDTKINISPELKLHMLTAICATIIGTASIINASFSKESGETDENLEMLNKLQGIFCGIDALISVGCHVYECATNADRNSEDAENAAIYIKQFDDLFKDISNKISQQPNDLKKIHEIQSTLKTKLLNKFHYEYGNELMNQEYCKIANKPPLDKAIYHSTTQKMAQDIEEKSGCLFM